MYRLYTEVKVSTGFIKPRAEGTRFDKSVETVTRCITVFYHETRAIYSNKANLCTWQQYT